MQSQISLVVKWRLTYHAAAQLVHCGKVDLIVNVILCCGRSRSPSVMPISTTNSFWQVDENGKITRLRRECPTPECGAGVFMASHFDRQYCGKCGLTYVFKPE